jgi:hypothetical protein
MIKRILFTVIAATTLAIAPVTFAADTSALNVTVGPEATFSAAFSATTLAAADTKFGGFAGTTNFSYKIRTTLSGGTGAITVQVTSFGSGGPAVADLAYTCTATAPGTACVGSTAASASVATGIATFSADAHSSEAGDAGSTAWTLVDKVAIVTGSYSSTATYTISAL